LHDIGADFGDHPGELMPGNMREGPDIRVMALPAVPITPADARRFHFNNHTIPWGDRVRDTRNPR